ncbi:MAG: extracellular solute-binding protein [Clostridiales bacterium]|nr:extracellular solute-binding protein [Clostridiales bacterium]
MKGNVYLWTAALLLFAVSITGCSLLDGLNPTPTPETTPLPTLPPPATSAPTPEPNEIVQLLPYHPFDPNADAVAKRLSEATGTALRFVMLPETGATEQLSIELSVGIEYDLITLTPGQYHGLADKNVWTPLGDRMAQAPDLAAVYTDEEWGAAMVDGALLGIPQFPARFVDEGIVINATVAEELDISAPQTPADLKSALRTVKKETDLIPLTGSGSILRPIMSGFGLGAQWTATDKSFANWVQSERFEEYLKYMADLYEDGLIDIDWGENTAETAAAKQDAGEAFAAVRRWDNPAKIQEGQQAIALAPLARDGKRVYEAGTAPDGFVVIPTTCADPDSVVAYLNRRAQSDMIVLAAVGAEGLQHERQGEDYVPLAGFADWRNARAFALATPTAMMTDLFECAVRFDTEVFAAYQGFNEGMADALVPSPVGYAPPSAALEGLTATLSQIVDAYFLEVLTGEKAVGKTFDSFTEQWLADGGKLVIEEYAAWKFGEPEPQS